MTYEEYKQKCDEIQLRNAAYLNEFREDLLSTGLKEKTINSHCFNVDFYINTYLLREEPLEMTYGTISSRINNFLGGFFIYKCMWSTSGAIKSTASSIKKFYSSMLKRGYIDESNYRELIETIRDNMDCWLNECKAYNNPDTPNPFTLF